MSDVTHMRRALELAAPRVGRTGENPSVGCVLVKEGAPVGEGATAEGGRPHAEEIALNAAGAAARGATTYVTLEPCAKRSAGGVACADLLIAAGVARLVIAAHDPHPNAAGAGVARLRAAGVTVEIGLMEAEARAQNAAFFARWDRRPDVALAPAAAEHVDFALSLYLRTMQPHAAALMTWDEARQREAFAAQWKPQEARIIRAGGADIGWLQIEIGEAEVMLRHFYIAPEHQRRGAGGEVLRRLIEEYAPTRKPFALAVLKNNPARRLYERLGFSITSEDEVKLTMRREP